MSQDAFLGGRLHLQQFRQGHHRGGTDGVLAAMAAAALSPRQVVDMGAGTGLIGLAIARLCPDARVTLVERNADLCALARGNVSANGLSERVSVIEADVLAAGVERRAAGLSAQIADCVVSNPPWFDEGRVREPRGAGRITAHVFAPTGDGVEPLNGWLRTANDIAAPGGWLVLVHRAEALPKLLQVLEGRFGDVQVRPVHAHKSKPAIRVLILAKKGSRAAMSLCPALVLHDDEGGFTTEAAALHAGLAVKQFRTR